jgi:hypothetical protein
MKSQNKVLLLLSVGVIFNLFPILVSADEKASETLKIIQKIEKQDPAKLRVEKFNNRSEYIKGDLNIKIDKDNRKILVKNRQKRDFSIGIPSIENQKVISTEGQIVHNSEKIDIIIQPIEGGIRQVVNIKNSEAPKAYQFPIELSRGYNMKINTRGGVDIINNSGQIESGILPPWAKDAEGKDIKTWYTLDGNILTQHIDTTNAIYPILADPVYCSQYANSVWNEWRGGWDTIRVIPSGCGRAFSRDNLSGSFLEVHRKSGRQLSGSRYNSTFWQWKCHTEWAQVFPGTWDLEIARPDVGYWGTVRSQCNPT